MWNQLNLAGVSTVTYNGCTRARKALGKIGSKMSNCSKKLNSNTSHVDLEDGNADKSNESVPKMTDHFIKGNENEVLKMAENTVKPKDSYEYSNIGIPEVNEKYFKPKSTHCDEDVYVCPEGATISVEYRYFERMSAVGANGMHTIDCASYSARAAMDAELKIKEFQNAQENSLIPEEQNLTVDFKRFEDASELNSRASEVFKQSEAYFLEKFANNSINHQHTNKKTKANYSQTIYTHTAVSVALSPSVYSCPNKIKPKDDFIEDKSSLDMEHIIKHANLVEKFKKSQELNTDDEPNIFQVQYLQADLQSSNTDAASEQEEPDTILLFQQAKDAKHFQNNADVRHSDKKEKNSPEDLNSSPIRSGFSGDYNCIDEPKEKEEMSAESTQYKKAFLKLPSKAEVSYNSDHLQDLTTAAENKLPIVDKDSEANSAEFAQFVPHLPNIPSNISSELSRVLSSDDFKNISKKSKNIDDVCTYDDNAYENFNNFQGHNVDGTKEHESITNSAVTQQMPLDFESALNYLHLYKEFLDSVIEFALDLMEGNSTDEEKKAMSILYNYVLEGFNAVNEASLEEVAKVTSSFKPQSWKKLQKRLDEIEKDQVYARFQKKKVKFSNDSNKNSSKSGEGQEFASMSETESNMNSVGEKFDCSFFFYGTQRPLPFDNV